MSQWVPGIDTVARWWRARVQSGPAAAMAAPTPMAHGMPNWLATRPKRIGPRPSPMSIAALAVPDAAPRCDGSAVAKIAAKKAGVLNATPTAATAAPRIRPGGRWPRRSEEESGRDRAESHGPEGERRQTVGDPRERDPARAAHASLDAARDTGVRKSHARAVQRGEGEESSRRQEGCEEPDKDRQRGAVDEVRERTVLRRPGPGLPDHQTEDGREDGQCRGADPGVPESEPSHEDLAQRRPES